MKVIVIRHGMITPPKDSEGNDLMYLPDISLNDAGKAQAEKLANKLLDKGLHLEKIYSSPFTRALEYAQLIAAKMGIQQIISDNELRDPDVPGWIGKTGYEIESVDSYTAFATPEQETYEHVMTRMEQAFWRIYHENKSGSFGIVSHGDPIQLLVRRLRFPQESLSDVPRIDKLRESYLKRGDAWILEFNNADKLTRTEHIGEGFQFPSPERGK